jgi:cation:H+ antiporter
MVELLIEGLIFLVASGVLIKAASMAVKSIISLAKDLHLTEFVTSFVIAGLVSILPEFFVGVNSALAGVPLVGIGTLIGNNIVDLTLVIGIIAILGREIPVQRKGHLSTVPFLVAVGLPLGLMLDGNLSQVDGILLVAAAIIYFGWVLQNQPTPLREKKKPTEWKKLFPEMGKFVVFVGLIYGSAHFVVQSAVQIAHGFFFPEIFAGLFLISIGAALPELTFSIQAIMSRHKSVALGDVLGNVALDSTLSIGVMSIIHPFSLSLDIIGLSALFMVFAAFMLTTYLDSEKKLTRRDGIALIGLFIVFVVVQLTLNAAGGILLSE